MYYKLKCSWLHIDLVFMKCALGCCFVINCKRKHNNTHIHLYHGNTIAKFKYVNRYGIFS